MRPVTEQGSERGGVETLEVVGCAGGIVEAGVSSLCFVRVGFESGVDGDVRSATVGRPLRDSFRFSTHTMQRPLNLKNGSSTKGRGKAGAWSAATTPTGELASAHFCTGRVQHLRGVPRQGS